MRMLNRIFRWTLMAWLGLQGVLLQEGGCSGIIAQYTLQSTYTPECSTPYHLDPNDPTQTSCVVTTADLAASQVSGYLTAVANQMIGTWVAQRLRVPTFFNLGT